MPLLSIPSYRKRNARISELGTEIAHQKVDDAWQRTADQALELPPHQARGYLAARTRLMVRQAATRAVFAERDLPATVRTAVEQQAQETLITLLVSRIRSTRAARSAQRRLAA